MSNTHTPIQTNFIPEHVYFTDSFLACMAVEKQHQYEVGPKGKWQDCKERAFPFHSTSSSH
jgi:hypothetical protein